MSPASVQEIPSGVIIACPLGKFEVRHVAGVGVLMRLHYIERADQLESGEYSTLQTLLAPEQATAIEGALKKSVQALEFGKALKNSLKLLPISNPETTSLELCEPIAV
jgi:hypothetical protein